MIWGPELCIAIAHQLAVRTTKALCRSRKERTAIISIEPIYSFLLGPILLCFLGSFLLMVL